MESGQPEGPLDSGNRLGHPMDRCCTRIRQVSEDKAALENQSLPWHVPDRKKELSSEKFKEDEEIVPKGLQVLSENLASSI